MRDVETHTDDFLVLCPEAQSLSSQYKPSDVLDELMVGVRTRWTEYVESLTTRYAVCGLAHTALSKSKDWFTSACVSAFTRIFGHIVIHVYLFSQR